MQLLYQLLLIVSSSFEKRNERNIVKQV